MNSNFTTSHRLDGLEPDNLLAFLCLLGLLKVLGVFDQERQGSGRLSARVAWDLDRPPVRPRVYLAGEATAEDVASYAACGLETLARFHEFDGRRDLNYTRSECRDVLGKAAGTSGVDDRRKIDLLAALMSDVATKVNKNEEVVDGTPLCLLFGQGHQHFLERLATVPNQIAPAPGRRRENAATAADCLAQALFQPWHRKDDAFSFRWDPEEDVRYALMAGDPTDAAYRTGTQHGANRLAAVGLSALTVAPEKRGGRIRPNVLGGTFDDRGFSFAWPIWREPATLAAIRGMLAHPALRTANGLANMGVEYAVAANRLSVGKFMNFSRARRL